MTYTPVHPGGWKNAPENTTPIDANALNTIEQGIVNAAAVADAAAVRTLLDGTVRSAGFTVVGNTVHMVDISGGSFAANLPAANSLPAGTPVIVKVRAAASSLGSTAVTITPAGSDTIDGSLTGLPLRYANQAKTLVTDGSSNWVPTSGDLTKTVLDALYAPVAGSSVYATQTQLGTYVPQSQLGAASGVATLDSSTRLPKAQLPLVGAVAVSTDGSFGLPTPTGQGSELVIVANALSDIRFNGVSL